eukprot:c9376_g1_i1.p1 GENE.c9376_g1_i1~~c9376_g1_i1.p1  ORF type:complete len:895 (-),score=298.32 c9376_g1_i1:77-2524(-)
MEDHRIGEGNPLMSAEQKAAARFQRERLSRAKAKERYNLEEGTLTHLGKSLTEDVMAHEGKGEGDDEEEWESDQEEDRELRKGYIDEDTVLSAHFGGGTGETDSSGARLTRREIYQQVVARSKAARSERQAQKLEQEEKLEKLDTEFDVLKTLMAGHIRSKNDREKMDGFDQLAKELVFDRTARPSRKELTADEVIAQEKERLEMLERERLKRMKGEESEEDEEDGPPKHVSGDDLEGNFAVDTSFAGQSRGVLGDGDEEEEDDDDGDGEEEEEAEEDEGEEGEEGSEGEEGDDDDEDDDDDERLDASTAARINFLSPASDSESDANERIENGDEQTVDADSADETEVVGVIRVPTKPFVLPEDKPAAVVSPETSAEDSSIPFTFPLPKDGEALWQLLDQFAEAQHATVLHRMFTCNHIGDSDERKGDMQRCLELLLAQFLEVCKAQPVVWSRVNALTSATYLAAQQVPEFAYDLFAKQLQHIRNGVVKDVHRHAGGVFRWPTLPHLCFFRLIGHVFPVTDARHRIVTPLFVHIAQTFTHSPLTSGRHVLTGLFLATLCLQYLHQPRRYFPEVFHFLFRLLPTQSHPSTPLTLQHADSSIRSALVTSLPIGLLYNHPTNLEHLETDTFRLNALTMTYRILIGFMGSLSHRTATADLYRTVENHLKFTEKEAQNYPEPLAALRTSLKNKLSGLMINSGMVRFALQLHKRAPVPIRQFDPAVNDSVFDRRAAPKSAKEEKRKMQRMLKQETKGAIRELRKDNAFLAQQRDELDKRQRAKREAKRKATMAFLEEQEATYKQQAKEYRTIKRKMANKKR